MEIHIYKNLFLNFYRTIQKNTDVQPPIRNGAQILSSDFPKFQYNNYCNRLENQVATGF